MRTNIYDVVVNWIDKEGKERTWTYTLGSSTEERAKERAKANAKSDPKNNFRRFVGRGVVSVRLRGQC